jgi:DNA-binding YbaB/EbfC family protein
MKMPGNMQKMMQQAQQMQQNLQEQVSQIRVETSTGGGMVTVKMDGNKKVLSIHIDPEALDDRDMLQDMVRGAVNEATNRVDEEAQSKMGGLLGNMGLPPGLMS